MGNSDSVISLPDTNAKTLAKALEKIPTRSLKYANQFQSVNNILTISIPHDNTIVARIQLPTTWGSKKDFAIIHTAITVEQYRRETITVDEFLAELNPSYELVSVLRHIRLQFEYASECGDFETVIRGVNSELIEPVKKYLEDKMFRVNPIDSGLKVSWLLEEVEGH